MIAHRSLAAQTTGAIPFEIFLDLRVLPLGLQFIVSTCRDQRNQRQIVIPQPMQVFIVDNIAVVRRADHLDVPSKPATAGNGSHVFLLNLQLICSAFAIAATHGTSVYCCRD